MPVGASHSSDANRLALQTLEDREMNEMMAAMGLQKPKHVGTATVNGLGLAAGGIAAGAVSLARARTAAAARAAATQRGHSPRSASLLRAALRGCATPWPAPVVRRTPQRDMHHHHHLPARFASALACAAFHPRLRCPPPRRRPATPPTLRLRQVALPYAGAKKSGVRGFLGGAVGGLAAAAALPVAGALAGATQVVRGAAQTPKAIYEASQGKTWSASDRRWIHYSLPDELERYVLYEMR